jgi:hypothetical protein
VFGYYGMGSPLVGLPIPFFGVATGLEPLRPRFRASAGSGTGTGNEILAMRFGSKCGFYRIEIDER